METVRSPLFSNQSDLTSAERDQLYATGSLFSNPGNIRVATQEQPEGSRATQTGTQQPLGQRDQLGAANLTNPHGGVATLVAIGIAFVAVSSIVALFKSKGEPAKRAKIVIIAILGLGLAAVIFSVVGLGGLAVLLAILGAGYWIFKGRDK